MIPLQRKKSLLYVFVFLLLGFGQQAVAQYTVVKKEGSIQAKNTSIEIGSQLTDSCLLVFGQETDRLLLLNDSLDLFWAEYVSEPEWPLVGCLRPCQQSGHRGFRRKAQAVRDLNFYLGSGDFTVLGDTLSILLDESTYPMDAEHFIVFYYKINGVQQAKQIAFDHQLLRLNKSELFAGKGQVQAGESLSSVGIYRYEPKTKHSEKITTINLNFIPKEKLRNELKVFEQVGQRAGLASELLQKRSESFITNFYGRTDPAQLNSLFN